MPAPQNMHFPSGKAGVTLDSEGQNMTNDFVTVDLSTFDTGKAKDFYGALFDWQFDQDADGYIQAHTNNHPVAGVYLMPEFFQKIRMPSF